MILLHLTQSYSQILYSDIASLVLLILAGLAAAVLVSLGVFAFSRRQSRSYLLVVLALATLVCKAGAGGFTLVGILPFGLHHLLEHGLDLVMATLLIAAVYYGRTTSPEIHDIN